MTSFEIYLLLMANNFHLLLRGVFVISLVIIVITHIRLLMFRCTNEFEGHKTLKRWHNVALVTAVMVLVVRLFVPSTEKLVLIYGIPYITNNKKVETLTSNSYKLLDSWLDTKIKQLNKTR